MRREPADSAVQAVILGLLVAAAARSPAAVADNSEMASSEPPRSHSPSVICPRPDYTLRPCGLSGWTWKSSRHTTLRPRWTATPVWCWAAVATSTRAYYGEIAAGTRNPNPKRDEMELELFRLARKRDLAVLGICRGLQLMNVACGGTLHQDIGTGTRRCGTR